MRAPSRLSLLLSSSLSPLCLSVGFFLHPLSLGLLLFAALFSRASPPASVHSDRWTHLLWMASERCCVAFSHHALAPFRPSVAVPSPLFRSNPFPPLPTVLFPCSTSLPPPMPVQKLAPLHPTNPPINQSPHNNKKITQDDTYKYNFEFETPGDPTSSDLSVEDPPSSQAGAFICGNLVPTPAPVITATPPPPTPTPTPPPTPTATTPQPTAAPQTAPTAAPVPAATVSPIQSTAEPVTEAPVVAVTDPPTAVATEPPVGVTAAPVSTPAPLGGATPGPSIVPVNGTVDTVAPTPVAGGEVTVAPSAAGGGSGVNASQSPTPVDESTVAPSVAGARFLFAVAVVRSGVASYWWGH